MLSYMISTVEIGISNIIESQTLTKLCICHPDSFRINNAYGWIDKFFSKATPWPTLFAAFPHALTHTMMKWSHYVFQSTRNAHSNHLIDWIHFLFESAQCKFHVDAIYVNPFAFNFIMWIGRPLGVLKRELRGFQRLHFIEGVFTIFYYKSLLWFMMKFLIDSTSYILWFLSTM